MRNLLDIFFGFPSSADAAFVERVLGLIEAPVAAVGHSGRVRHMNLQAKGLMVLVLEPKKRQPVGPRRRGRLSGRLLDAVRGVLASGEACVLNGYVPGLRHKQMFDILVCPGRVQGTDLGFLVGLPAEAGGIADLEAAAGRLLDSIGGPVLFIDREVRYTRVNTRYLETFNFRAEEILGKRLVEVNPSEQAEALERQGLYLMQQGKTALENRYPLPTAKLGVAMISVLAWPVCAVDHECHGLVAVYPESASLDLGQVADVGTYEVLGRTVDQVGPPHFYTHVDGRVVLMNRAAKLLISGGTADVNLKTSIAWTHPEIVESLYERIVGGSEYGAVLTEARTASGAVLYKVRAFGIRGYGGVMSQVLVVLNDVTDSERISRSLADTARSLADEQGMLEKILDSVSSLVFVLDESFMIVRANAAFAGRFGLTPESVRGQKIADLDPSVRTTGFLSHVRTVLRHRKPVCLPRFVHITRQGEQAPASLWLYPVAVGMKPACLIVVEEFTEIDQVRSELARKTAAYGALFSNVDAAVAVLDKTGTVVDINPFLERRWGRREDIVGRKATDVLPVEEKDLLSDFLKRALRSRQRVRTGPLRLTRTGSSDTIFGDAHIIPMLDDDGNLGQLLAIVHLTPEAVNVERRLEESTSNLERLVAERTQELTAANAELESAVGRIASVARSGMLLGSLRDRESVFNTFVDEVRKLLPADFVSLALVDRSSVGAKTVYYSAGQLPPSGAIPSEVMEQSVARLLLGPASSGGPRSPRPNILLIDLDLTDTKGLLIVWKGTGEFSSLDSELGALMCANLGSALPVSAYVSDLRRETGRCRCLRQIALQVAGTSSVGDAIRIVAREASSVVAADRFLWLVCENGNDIWLREIFRPSGLLAGDVKRVTVSDLEGVASVFSRAQGSGKGFCDRFHAGGDAAIDGDWQWGRHCPFGGRSQNGEVLDAINGIVRSTGLGGKDGGAMVAAPVVLSEGSWGVICAQSDHGRGFAADDGCFLCLAASSVRYLWQAADAASLLRRVKAAGDTVAEFSHDLKYPLLRIRENLKAIQGCSASGSKSGRAMKRMHRETERLAALLQELADVSNAGKRSEPLDVGEIVDCCVSIAAGDRSERRARVENLVGSVPPVIANRADATKIFINVLANCVEAAGHEGRVAISATVAKSETGSLGLDVVFEDSGPGIGVNDLEKVFDAFYTTKKGGSGLGLFSARKRARANGGDVFCAIGPDGKSEFIVRLPLA